MRIEKPLLFGFFCGFLMPTTQATITLKYSEFSKLTEYTYKIIPTLLDIPKYSKPGIIPKVSKEMNNQLSASLRERQPLEQQDKSEESCMDDQIITFHFLNWNSEDNIYEIDFEYIDQLIAGKDTTSQTILSKEKLLYLRSPLEFPLTGNALFLSAKREEDKAKFIAEARPELNIYLTDLAFKDQIDEDKFHLLPMDNTEPFPFADNFMDVISMNMGLCSCENKMSLISCGGITQCSAPQDSLFFNEIFRVMNKNNPHALVVLHGGAIDTPQSFRNFYQVTLTKINEKYENRFKITFSHDGKDPYEHLLENQNDRPHFFIIIQKNGQ